MLDGFRRLGNAAPEKILAYAGRWGVLGICEHGLPASHRPLRLTDPAMPTCEPLHLPAGDYDEHYDPLSGWHFLASATQALLNIAARLHNGNVGQAEDWRAVYANSPAMPGGWPDFWDRRPRSRDVDIMELCNRVDDWLEMGNVRPTLSRLAWLDKGAPELEFGSTWRDGALFGALALQLALAIGRVDGLAVCTACRVTYIPRRRCNPSRHNFCPECGVRASWRLAQDKRRRQ